MYYTGEILEVLLPLLNRQPFPISLSSLANIERAVVERFDSPSFHPLSRVSFLDFLVSDAQCKAALGGSLTVSASAIDDSGKRRVVEIVSQLRHNERADKVSCTLFYTMHTALHMYQSLYIVPHCIRKYLFVQKNEYSKNEKSIFPNNNAIRWSINCYVEFS